MAYRDNTKVIHIGDRVIGGGNPILIQSMTNTKTEDAEATAAQIRAPPAGRVGLGLYHRRPEGDCRDVSSARPEIVPDGEHHHLRH